MTAARVPTGLIGVIGPRDAAAQLQRLGWEPGWCDDGVALYGTAVWVAPEGDLVVAGEPVLDVHSAIPPNLPPAGIEPLQHFAELYRHFGVDAGRYALGMYALAVWDRRERRLELFRDGTGARSVYCAGAGSEWWFSDRASALRRSPVVSGQLSVSALQAYLSLAYVPGELTLRRDVRELRPGTALRLPGAECTTYWEPRERLPEPGITLEECAESLRPLLEESVRCRLPQAGPVGIYLSGGLDSSLVVALAARLAPGPVHTYAIHFGAGHRNELEFSSLVASHCRTRHRVLELPIRDIRDSLPETMAALDDPIGDPLTVPNLLLGRAARQDVSVILNGEGGDPLFGGPKNLPMLLHELYGSDTGREVL
jgi:asparagine synthase (glutamine-hydrolysing)